MSDGTLIYSFVLFIFVYLLGTCQIYRVLESPRFACRLAKQGILVSQQQLNAFLTPGITATPGSKLDYTTFVALSRPRAPIPVSKPSYVRAADYSSDGRANLVGYDAKEGYGEFGLVDPMFSDAQQHPLVSSQAVAFTRGNNTLPIDTTASVSGSDSGVMQAAVAEVRMCSLLCGVCERRACVTAAFAALLFPGARRSADRRAAPHKRFHQEEEDRAKCAIFPRRKREMCHLRPVRHKQ